MTDASPEMLALNRGKLGERANVRYQVADAFDPGGDASYDVVFFGFFLSHVPRDRFDAFWTNLRGVLAPGGRVFFVDEAQHGLWREDWIDEAAGIVRRTLMDGVTYRAVKVLWRPDALRDRLGDSVGAHRSGTRGRSIGGVRCRSGHSAGWRRGENDASCPATRGPEQPPAGIIAAIAGRRRRSCTAPPPDERQFGPGCLRVPSQRWQNAAHMSANARRDLRCPCCPAAEQGRWCT